MIPSFLCSAVIPGAFQSAVHGVITGKDYKSGVQTTLRAGGCNASRGGFIGACLAAQVRRQYNNFYNGFKSNLYIFI